MPEVMIRVEYQPEPSSLMDPMNNCRVLLLAGVAALLPVLAADEKEKPKAAPVVQVVLKRISLPSGETLGEVATRTADVDDLHGTLSINMGTAEQPRHWTVEFSEGTARSGEGLLYLSVCDTALLRQGVREGTSWTAPVELFEVTAPFDGSGVVSIYRTKTESMTLEITPVADAAKEKPEAK